MMDVTASILLVEDSRLLSEALSTALQERGYTVTIASDGAQACALLAAPDSDFTALVTDLDLGPGPNGWDVARTARTRNANVVVIYVTGGDGAEWAAVGVPKSLILQKPFSAEQLVRAVNAFDEGLARDAAASNLEEIAALHMRLDTVEEANRRLDDAAQAETLRRSRELLEDVTALAEARAKAAAVEAELAAREAAIAQLAAANRKLVANEAMLGTIVEQRTVALTREMEERRIAEQGGERATEEDGAAAPGRVAALRKTILLVEDNLLLADITAALFRQLDYDTVPAANARDALTLLEAGAKVDAVFCDVVMPGEMDGVELARVLHRDYPALPITLTTGYGIPAGNAAPACVEVLSKPYRLDDLEAAVERAFSRLAGATAR